MSMDVDGEVVSMTIPGGLPAFYFKFLYFGGVKSDTMAEKAEQALVSTFDMCTHACVWACVRASMHARVRACGRAARACMRACARARACMSKSPTAYSSFIDVQEVVYIFSPCFNEYNYVKSKGRRHQFGF